MPQVDHNKKPVSQGNKIVINNNNQLHVPNHPF
jgi:hypothetical protein